MNKQDFLEMGKSSGLKISQIESALQGVLSWDTATLFRNQEIPVTKIYEIAQVFYKLSSGKPEAYVFEKQKFFGRDFCVSEDVLIPRYDTEILVKQVLRFLFLKGDLSETIYFDIGTGSGCIPISLILELNPLVFLHAFAGDISQKALNVAKKNAEMYKMSSLEFRNGSLLEPWFHEKVLEGKSLCITANLPYIGEKNKDDIAKDVLKFEPKLALFGGKETGFELYQMLIKQCFQLQKIFHIPNIDLFIEIGFDQYDISKNILQEFGLKYEYFKDENQIARIIHISGF